MAGRGRLLLLGRALAAVGRPAPAAGPRRGLGGTAAARGLEDLLQGRGGTAEEAGRAGRAWRAAELRGKSFEDLHRLWFVLLKERNHLKAVRAFARAQRRDIANPERLTKLRRSMARIKLVLSERAHQMEEGEQRAALKRMIDAM